MDYWSLGKPGNSRAKPQELWGESMPRLSCLPPGTFGCCRVVSEEEEAASRVAEGIHPAGVCEGRTEGCIDAVS